VEAIRFARPGANRALGCVVYLLLAGAGGLFVGLIVFVLGSLGLKSLGLPDLAAVLPAGLAAVGAVTFLVRLAWRDYRRRGLAEVVLAAEHLELEAGAERIEIPYAEVDVVRRLYDGSLRTLELEAADGRRARLPADIAPYPQVVFILGHRLLPGMLQRLERRLESGQDVPLLDSPGRSLRRMAGGLTMLLFAPLLILSIKGAGWGFAFLRQGPARIRQGCRGLRGGFTLTRDGLRPPGEEMRAIPWSELAALRLDDDGVVLQSMELRRYSASSLAPNFWPVSELLRARLPAMPPGQPKGE